jgi:hypothetical protein
MADVLVEAVDELQILVSGDGARLEVVDSDPSGLRLHLRVDLSEVECLDCVLPAEQLREMLGDSIRRRTGLGVDVIVDDPRDDG